MSYSGLANWKCKCGRGPSLEHGVGEYCSGRIVIEALESECAALIAEVSRLSRKTGFCAQCEADAKERDSLILTLAKERDEFGKRETELIRDCTASKAKLDNQMDGMGLLEKSIERQASRTHEIQAERDALKAELEKLKTPCKEHCDGGCFECIEKDRDHWRGIAEKLYEALSISRGQWIHSVNKTQALKAISLFDEAVEPLKHGPGTGCKCTACETWEA